MEAGTLMARINQWEEAWSDYVSCLERNDSIMPGEDFVIDCGRSARNLNDAKNRLRSIDIEFCKSLGI